MNAKGSAEAARLNAELAKAKKRILHQIGQRAVVYARAACPIESGKLRRSIAYQVTGDTVRVGASAPYAEHVENGTKNMRARPFLRPALQNHTAEYKRIAERELRKVK